MVILMSKPRAGDSFSALTSTQQECLAYYAFPGLMERQLFLLTTTDALVSKGLLTRVDRRIGNLTIHDFEMPLAVHIAYCQWCAETLETLKKL